MVIQHLLSKLKLLHLEESTIIEMEAPKRSYRFPGGPNALLVYSPLRFPAESNNHALACPGVRARLDPMVGRNLAVDGGTEPQTT